MRISSQRKVRKIGERLATALPVDVAVGCVPTDHLSNLDVQQMRDVQCFARVE